MRGKLCAMRLSHEYFGLLQTVPDHVEVLASMRLDSVTQSASKHRDGASTIPCIAACLVRISGLHLFRPFPWTIHGTAACLRGLRLVETIL